MSDQAGFLKAVTSGDLEGVRARLAENPALAGACNETGTPATLLALYHQKGDIAALLVAAKESLSVFEAAAFGRTASLAALLDADAALADAFAGDGFNPLGLAAFFGHEEAVALLLGRGAQVGTASRNAMKVTALHAATAARSLPIVRRLLEAGIDVDAAQQQDFTALHEAVRSNQPLLVKMLLAHGANPLARAADGRTPVSIAEAAGSQDLVALLAASLRPGGMGESAP